MASSGCSAGWPGQAPCWLERREGGNWYWERWFGPAAGPGDGAPEAGAPACSVGEWELRGQELEPELVQELEVVLPRVT